MITACCVYDCPGNVPEPVAGTSTTRLHPFPIGDPTRLAVWCKLLMMESGPGVEELYVCRNHFSPQQYDFSSDSKQPLKCDAVPDCNLPKDKKTHPAAAPRSTDGVDPPVLVVDDLDKVCRLCLEMDEQTTHEPLFAKEDIVEFIVQSIGIEIQPNDGYPQTICPTCIERVTYIHRSRERFHKNDLFLKSLVGELSNAPELTGTVPPAVGEPTAEPKIEVEATQLLDAEFAEAEETTQSQKENNTSCSEDEPPARRKRPRRRTIQPLKKPDARLKMIKQCRALERKRIGGELRCSCGAFFAEVKLLRRHIWDDHDAEGNVKPPPPNPLLEEMAAIFNGLRQDTEPEREAPSRLLESNSAAPEDGS